jgi:hypothetical protein
MAHRAQALKYWLRKSLQLRSQESELAATLEPGVAEVLQGKRILVWKEMLQSINYSDMGVVDEFCDWTDRFDKFVAIESYPSYND